MKLKLGAIAAIMFCVYLSPSAMVIHNYCDEKDTVEKAEPGVFNEDYLFLGKELKFSGEAEDLVFLGKKLTTTGKTKLGLFALCEKLVFSGSSGNGIMAGAMDVVVNGQVASNSYIGCKSFSLSDTAIMNGNLFIGCAKLSIDGKLNGDLYAGAGEIIINNEIHGNVTAYSGRITIGKKGKISGNLTYSTKENLSAGDLAKVTGTVKIDTRFKNKDKDWDSFVNFMKSFGFIIGIFLLLSYVAIGCILLFLPVFKKIEAQQSEHSFWKTSLWGLMPVLMYPAIIALCFIFVLTIPFAFVLLLAFVPLFFIANIIGATMVGKYLVKKFNWNVQKRHYFFLIGALAGAIICVIPFVNFIYMIFVVALGWGMYIASLFNINLTVNDSNQSPKTL
jgi:cytoskeletal protein CcmA (bactofilin family)